MGLNGAYCANAMYLSYFIKREVFQYPKTSSMLFNTKPLGSRARFRPPLSGLFEFNHCRAVSTLMVKYTHTYRACCLCQLVKVCLTTYLHIVIVTRHELYKTVFVSPDMTKYQRSKHKQLVEELKRRRVNQPNLVIRDGVIVTRTVRPSQATNQMDTSIATPVGATTNSS